MPCVWRMSEVLSLASWTERGPLHQPLLRELKTLQSACLACQVSLLSYYLPSTLLPACSVEVGVKYSGHNLYPAKGKTQMECAALCLHERECNYWTHNARLAKCWLKKSERGRSPSTHGSNSGQKSCGVTGKFSPEMC